MARKAIFMALVGLPSSGKTTYANQYEKENVVKVFSSDEYRKKICDDRKDQTKNDKVFKALYADLRAALENGEDCILDATNCTIKDRLRALKAIEGVDCVKIASIISTDTSDCVKRNSRRPEEEKLPDKVVYKYAQKFEVPLPWEGWDKIYFQGYDTDFCPRLNERVRELTLNSINNFNQKTPHHNWTLRKHCELAAEQFPDDRVLHSAALFHDVGKAWGEFDWTEKPEEGVRHYYHHANLSCFYMLQNLGAFDCQTWDEVYEVLFLIQEHMNGRELIEPGEKRDLWISRVGKKWLDDLGSLVKADEIACGNSDHTYHEEITKKVKAGYYTEHPEELIPEDYIEPLLSNTEEVEQAELHIESEQNVQEIHAENEQNVQEIKSNGDNIEEEVGKVTNPGVFGGLGGLFEAMMGGLGGMIPDTEKKEEENNANPETEGDTSNHL